MNVDRLTIVVPVFGCAPCIEKLYDNGDAALRGRGIEPHWIFVDDASVDGAWSVLQALCGRASNIQCYRLERNVGQHAAIAFGMARSLTEWTAVMDCDLQDRDGDIADLLQRAREGYDAVIAATDSDRPPLRQLGGRVYRRLLGIPGSFGTELRTMSVLSSKARTRYLERPESADTYLLALARTGLPLAEVKVCRAARPIGTSSYDLGRLFRLAARNLIKYAIGPLLGIAAAVSALFGLGTAALLGFEVGLGAGVILMTVLALLLIAVRFWLVRAGAARPAAVAAESCGG